MKDLFEHIISIEKKQSRRIETKESNNTKKLEKEKKKIYDKRKEERKNIIQRNKQGYTEAIREVEAAISADLTKLTNKVQQLYQDDRLCEDVKKHILTILLEQGQ